jgi:hypothetical protein
MVKIIDDWYFEADDKQYILIHQYEKEKGVFGKKGENSGETVVKKEEVAYFQTVTSMLRRLPEILAKEKVVDGQIQTIRDYISELEPIEKKLHEMCKGY